MATLYLFLSQSVGAVIVARSPLASARLSQPAAGVRRFSRRQQLATRPPLMCVAAEDLSAEVAQRFGSALQLAWRANDSSLLRQVLPSDATVTTPLWQCADRTDYERELLEVAAFFSERATPVLSVLSHRRVRAGTYAVRWMLAVEWPAVWRARVNILGESELALERRGGTDGAAPIVRAVVERWHQPPREVFATQVLPRLRDVLSVWNAPTAEHVPLETLPTAAGATYELVQLPPMLAVQAEWIETGEALYSEQAPLPPAFAFTGRVKRTEWYSVVSPGILERSVLSRPTAAGGLEPAQRRRWVLPLPMRYGGGADLSGLPDPDGGASEEPFPADVVEQSIQYVRRPAQRLALARVKGSPTNAAILGAVQSVAAAAAADGLRVAFQGGQPVFVHLCYDVKIGWNSRRELAMAVWLSVPQWLEDNLVGVVIDA